MRNSVVAVMLIAGAGAAGAATLVVRSSGPSAHTYPAGVSLADGTAIRLAAGDQLTLLDGGGSRVLRGPGSFAAGGAAPSAAVGTRFAALVGGATDRRVRIGAVRGVGETPRRPSLWYVDPTQAGRVCLIDAAGAILWRPRPDLDQRMTITGAGGMKASVAWGPGSNTIAWPASLPIVAGADYRVSLDGAAATTISFALLGARPATIGDAAGTLLRNRCTSQLDLVVDSVPAPSADTASAG